LTASDPKHFISIVDKAILHRKDLNEGPSDTQRRHGELSAHDLFAVAAEDGLPLPPGDVQVLAQACEIDIAALDIASAVSIDGAP
jgi:hypothetical protein